MIILPKEDGVGALPVAPTAALVRKMEESHGSLYVMTDRLIDGSLPLSSIIEILKIVYRHAGSETPDGVLDEFILQQPCTEMLSSVLLGILQPVEKGKLSEEAL